MKRIAWFFICLTPALVTPVAAESYSACAPIPEPLARLACYDRVAEREESIADSQLPLGDRPHLSSLPAKQDDTAQFGLSPRRAPEASFLTATVDNVQRSAFGKLSIVLDNGQRWQQLDSAPLILNPGEPVVIHLAALGSHLMEKQSGSRRIRVRRVE